MNLHQLRNRFNTQERLRGHRSREEGRERQPSAAVSQNLEVAAFRLLWQLDGTGPNVSRASLKGQRGVRAPASELVRTPDGNQGLSGVHLHHTSTRMTVYQTWATTIVSVA